MPTTQASWVGEFLFFYHRLTKAYVLILLQSCVLLRVDSCYLIRRILNLDFCKLFVTIQLIGVVLLL